MVQDLEVLAGGVHHHETGSFEDRPQRGEVDRQGVDQHEAVGPGDLHQGQLRIVGALPVELRVDREPGLVDQLVDDRTPRPLVVDEVRRGLGHVPPAQPGSRPVTVGWPASTQASVPPATLTASTPWARRCSATRRLRAPERQMRKTSPPVGTSSTRSAISLMGSRTAPGTWPSAYSFASRTSISGTSRRWASVWTSISGTCGSTGRPPAGVVRLRGAYRSPVAVGQIPRLVGVRERGRI